jgi:hypothetical protein
MESGIVDVALAFDFWIFGGYVRDVVIRGNEAHPCGDIDVACELKQAPMINTFIRTLATRHDVTVLLDSKDRTTDYGTMSPSLTRLIKLQVGATKVDICVFESRHAWMAEQSCDFTCNLFYQTRTCHLGIRYIPRSMRHRPSPVKDILELTRTGQFQVIYEPFGMSTDETHMINRVCARARTMMERGWEVNGPMLIPAMAEFLENIDPAYRDEVLATYA